MKTGSGNASGITRSRDRLSRVPSCPILFYGGTQLTPKTEGLRKQWDSTGQWDSGGETVLHGDSGRMTTHDGAFVTDVELGPLA